MAKIVCIEDEVELRKILTEELLDAGHDIHLASNGTEGIEVILTEQPDLVICDCLMPVMSGVQMFERLRTLHPESRDLPFLFLSAYADPRFVKGVLALGAHGYLTKPVDMDRLLETVDHLLAEHPRELESSAAEPSDATRDA